jgi:DNA-binding Xre family transcriptional regulator
MRFDKKKLIQTSEPLTQEALEKMRQRRIDRHWLALSGSIALKTRRILSERKITGAELALSMGVTPAQVSKILSGKENLGLKTISKLEEALGEPLLTI